MVKYFLFSLFFYSTGAQTLTRCAKESVCSCTAFEGTTKKGLISLESLDSHNDTSPRFSKVPGHGTDSGAFFYFNPCSAFGLSLKDVTPDQCTLNEGAAACQRDGSILYDTGTQDTADFSVENGKVYVKYSYVDTSRSTAYTRASKIDLVCNEHSTDDTLVFLEEDTHIPQTSTYKFTLTSRWCCPKSSGSGLSVGSVLLIVFFCVLIAYFICGAIYMKVRVEATGSEVVPNKGFWFALPGLVKEGVVFSVSKCKKSDSSSYEKV